MLIPYDVTVTLHDGTQVSGTVMSYNESRAIGYFLVLHQETLDSLPAGLQKAEARQREVQRDDSDASVRA